MENLKKVFVVGAIYLTIVLIPGLLESCNPQTNCTPCPASPTANPNINLRTLDQATGANLFFGSQAKYTFAQLKIRHIINGKPDTAYLRIDSVDKSFNINIPTVHSTDTVTFQIDNQPADTFLFNTSAPDRCCGFIKLNSVLFDGAIIYNSTDGTKIIEIKK